MIGKDADARYSSTPSTVQAFMITMHSQKSHRSLCSARVLPLTCALIGKYTCLRQVGSQNSDLTAVHKLTSV